MEQQQLLHVWTGMYQLVYGTLRHFMFTANTLRQDKAGLLVLPVAHFPF